MARPRDIVRWLTGFIGYASLPRPDILQPLNRLKTATNVWLGGAAGVGERRLGMHVVQPHASQFNALVTVPIAYNSITYSMVIASNGTLYTSTGAVPASFRTWTYPYGWFCQAVTINGKAHLIPTWPTGTPAIVDTTVASYPLPAAPTAANTGSGSYAAITRYYRVQWQAYAAGDSGYDLRGPVGPALSFTPSGTGTGVVVTMPATGGSSYWLLWASADNLTYYLLAQTAIGTTTVTDSTAGATEGALAANYLAANNTTLVDNLMGTPVRRVGMLAVASAPTAADQGSGTYAATLRYYRLRWVEVLGGTTLRRGEPSSAVSFTPSGTGEFARVTRPSTPDAAWGATHWELEGSADGTTFYRLNTVVATASTLDDDLDPAADYSSLPLSDTLGDYTEPPESRTAVADRDRLLLGGGWTSNFSRVWYTPVLGSSNVSDDERIPTANYVDIEAQDDDEIRAMVGPILNAILVFKRRSIFRLTRTGNATAPYEITKIAEGLGCDGPDYVCLGPGPTYGEAAYFSNTRGKWRYDGDSGMFTRLDNDLTTEWEGATTHSRVVYYPTRHAILFGEYAYSITTGGWTWQDWTHGNVAHQAVGRFLASYNATPVLVMPTTGAATDGLCVCDMTGYTTDADSHDYVAEVRTNRFSLGEQVSRWRPVRMRVWGSGGHLEVRTFTDSQQTTAAGTQHLNLGANQDGVDLTALALTGPVEWLSLSVRDSSPVSTWTLDGIEITGLPQEPIP